MFVHRHAEKDIRNFFSLIICEVSAVANSMSSLGVLWTELCIWDNEYIVDVVPVLYCHVVN